MQLLLQKKLRVQPITLPQKPPQPFLLTRNCTLNVHFYILEIAVKNCCFQLRSFSPFAPSESDPRTAASGKAFESLPRKTGYTGNPLEYVILSDVRVRVREPTFFVLGNYF